MPNIQVAVFSHNLDKNGRVPLSNPDFGVFRKQDSNHNHTMNYNCSNKIPDSPDGWLSEISEAYFDAYQAIPFGVFILTKIKEKDLFQIAPQICIKFRGIEYTKTILNKATQTMLCSYVASEENNKELFKNPHLRFSFCYLASHYGLGLLSVNKLNKLMEYIEKNQNELKHMIEIRCKKRSA